RCLIARQVLTINGGQRSHLGIFWQFLGLLCHFEAGQQFHITWCATGCDKAIALVSLCCAVFAPVFLQFAARVLLVSQALRRVAPRQAWYCGRPAGTLDIEFWH